MLEKEKIKIIFFNFIIPWLYEYYYFEILFLKFNDSIKKNEGSDEVKNKNY